MAESRFKIGGLIPGSELLISELHCLSSWSIVYSFHQIRGNFIFQCCSLSPNKLTLIQKDINFLVSTLNNYLTLYLIFILFPKAFVTSKDVWEKHTTFWIKSPYKSNVSITMSLKSPKAENSYQLLNPLYFLLTEL